MTSLSTRFLAQPSEMMPTRIGRLLDFGSVTDLVSYAMVS